eukprot:TRINITY_DN10751_c0_g1_i3.p1 TRINITY_DN10751_c0_g1~~TRINITY_DN10751_c0_g1_i3.p1  ORF type:complete len:194 (-),score=23.00 TRINITY_DN10751_c0_g1_i3:289-870(-)
MVELGVPTIKFGPPAKPGKLREYVGLPHTRYDAARATEIYAHAYVRKEKDLRRHVQVHGHRYQQGGRLKDLGASSIRAFLPGYESLGDVYQRIGWEEDPTTGRWMMGPRMFEEPPSRRRRPRSSSSAGALPTAQVGVTDALLGGNAHAGTPRNSQELARSSTAGSLWSRDREFGTTTSSLSSTRELLKVGNAF